MRGIESDAIRGLIPLKLYGNPEGFSFTDQLYLALCNFTPPLVVYALANDYASSV